VATEDPNAAQDPTGPERRHVHDDQDPGYPVVLEVDPITGRPRKTTRVRDFRSAVHVTRDVRVWHPVT
jgi:hypothetical protein